MKRRTRIRQERRPPSSISATVLLFLLLGIFVPFLGSASAAAGGPPPPPPPPLPQKQQQQLQDKDHPHNNDDLRVVETEVWSPSTNSWIGSQQQERWTHYATGRPCVSPAQLAPPPQASFEGDWKIVLGDGRDIYGWDYSSSSSSKSSAEEQQQPNRRQRIWLRTIKYEYNDKQEQEALETPSSASNATKQRKRRSKSTLISTSKSLSTKRSQRTKPTNPTILLPKQFQQLQSLTTTAWQHVQDDWNFKGWGFSFYKSFLFKSSVGMALRLPLSVNWDVWERHPEWPRLSSSLAFFYSAPFNPTLYFSLSCSVNVEYLKYLFVQALIVMRHVIAVALLVLARGFLVAGSAVAYPVTRQLLHSQDDHWPVWDSLPSLRQSLHEQPQFSTSLQERVGVSYSWRISKKRGYETRRSIWHLYLPTLLALLQHADRMYAAGQRLWRDYTYNTIVSRYLLLLKKKSSDDKRDADTNDSDNKDSNKVVSLLEQAQESKWADWIVQRKTGSVGISTGYPIPDPPYFSCSALLSLSGFYFLQDFLKEQRKHSNSGSHSSSDSTALPSNDEQQQVTAAVTSSAMRRTTTSTSTSTTADDSALLESTSTRGGLQASKKTTTNA